MTKPRWYGASLANAHSCVDPAVGHDTGGCSHAARERRSFGLGTILMIGGPTMRWQRVSLAALHGRSHARNSAHNRLRVVIDRWFPDTLVQVEGRCMSSYSPVGVHDFIKRFSKTRKFQVVENKRGLGPQTYLKIRGITRLQGGAISIAIHANVDHERTMCFAYTINAKSSEALPWFNKRACGYLSRMGCMHTFSSPGDLLVSSRSRA